MGKCGDDRALGDDDGRAPIAVGVKRQRAAPHEHGESTMCFGIAISDCLCVEGKLYRSVQSVDIPLAQRRDTLGTGLPSSPLPVPSFRAILIRLYVGREALPNRAWHKFRAPLSIVSCLRRNG